MSAPVGKGKSSGIAAKGKQREKGSDEGGTVVEKRTNQGYEIIQSIEVGNAEFVLGVHQTLPEQFVTWKCSQKSDYYWDIIRTAY